MGTDDIQTTRELLDSLTGEGGLREFQAALRNEGFYLVFAPFLKNPVRPPSFSGNHNIKRVKDALDLKPINNCDLLLARIWSPLAEDEKISGYVLNRSIHRQGLTYERVNILAQVIFEIVGRNNTLSERLVRSSRFRLGEGKSIVFRLADEPQNAGPFSFKEVQGEGVVECEMSYSPSLAAALRKSPQAAGDSDLPGAFRTAVDGFLTRHEAGGYPALARFLRRSLCKDRQDTLEIARKEALSRIVEHDVALEDLRKAMSFFDAPLSSGSARADLVHHYGLYLDFLAMIQASILFSPWYQSAGCLLLPLAEDDDETPKSLCLVAVGRRPIASKDLKQLGLIGQIFLKEAARKQKKLKAAQDQKAARLQLQIFNSDKLNDKIKGIIALGDDQEAEKRFGSLQLLVKQLFVSDLFADGEGGQKEFRLLGVGVLANALGEVSRLLHEGMPCRFLLLFGPGSCWKLFSETISREHLSQLPLGVLLKSNYSIFQDPLVGAFVDSNVYPDGQGLSYLGRLKEQADEAWIRRETKQQKDLYILNSQSDGVVRVYGEGDLLAKWLHESGTLEVRPKTLDQGSFAGFFDSGHISEEVLTELIEALSQIEETPGEGTLIIFSKQKDIRPHISRMEPDDFQMNWASVTSFEFTDPRILRAILRRDGASVITPEGKVLLRQLVFPVDRKRKEAAKLNLSDHGITSLLGRGSRHLTAECLAQVLDLSHGNRIVAISVDGGVKIWPKEKKNS